MPGVKRHTKKQKKRIQENEEDEIHVKEKEMVVVNDTVVRTIPVKNLNISNSIVSYSHGVAAKFENHELPKGYNPKPIGPINTQKSSEVKNLKIKRNPEVEGIKGFTNNLKVALQIND